MTDNLPDRVLGNLDGQAALFDDPLRILALSDGDFASLVGAVRQHAGSVLAEVRRYVGLVAWGAWHRYDEKRYREFVADFAQRLGVEPRAVLDWRRAVTKADNLAYPTVAALRSAAAKGAGRKSNATPTRSIPADSQEAPAKTSEGVAPGAAARPAAPSGPSGGHGSAEEQAEDHRTGGHRPARPPALDTDTPGLRPPAPRPPSLRQVAAQFFVDLVNTEEGFGAKWTPDEAAVVNARFNLEMKAWRKANGIVDDVAKEASTLSQFDRARAAAPQRPIPSPGRNRAHDPTCSCFGCKPAKAAK